MSLYLKNRGGKRHDIFETAMLIVFFAICAVAVVLYIPSFSKAETLNDEYVARNIDTQKNYTTLRDAAKEALESQTIEIIKTNPKETPNDNFRLDVSGGTPNNITIQKSPSLGDAEVCIDCDYDYSIGSMNAGATFKNLSFSFGIHSYHGFYSSDTINFYNCNLYGFFMGYGPLNFYDCTFKNEANYGEYNMWTYCADINYQNCDFFSNGKFLNVYNSGYGQNLNIILDNCCFHNTGAANKSAVNVKATSNNGVSSTQLYFTVKLTNCSTQGNFPTTKRLNNPLVMIDDDNSAYVTITVDENILYPEQPKVETGLNKINDSKTITSTLSSGGTATEITWTSSNESAIMLSSVSESKYKLYSSIQTNNNLNSSSIIAGDSVRVTRVGNGFSRVTANDKFSGLSQIFYFGNPVLNFDMQGHGSQIDSQSFNPVDTSNLPTKPETPTCKNWIFKDWYTSPEFDEIFDFTKPVTEDTTIYAKWEVDLNPEPDPDPEPEPHKPTDPSTQETNALQGNTEIQTINFENIINNVTQTGDSLIWIFILILALIFISATFIIPKKEFSGKHIKSNYAMQKKFRKRITKKNRCSISPKHLK